jgi:hypothetical protein
MMLLEEGVGEDWAAGCCCGMQPDDLLLLLLPFV